MNQFDPTQTVKDLKSASDKAEKLSKKWSESTATKGALKTFMADNKGFFEKASTVMGVLSVGCSAADALGLFGPSEHKQVMDKLDVIDKKLDDLNNSMNAQFKAVTVQIDYNTVNAILANNEADISAQISHYQYYLIQVKESNPKKLIDAKNALLDSADTLDKDINAYYEAFTINDASRNILSAVCGYFAGAPGPLISKGYNMIYMVQEAAKIIGLKQRLRKEKLEKDFDLVQCIESVDSDFNYKYKPKITQMLECLELKINEAISNVEKSIPDFFELRLKKQLKANNPNTSNPTMLCSQLEESYPFINFMSIEYAPCKGDSEHLDGLRASRAIAQYRLKEINRNLEIWWQWKPEPGSYSQTDLINKSVALLNSGKVYQLSQMAEYTKYSEYADMHTVWKHDYDIPRLIKDKFKTDLFHYSAGAQALIIRKDKAGQVNWAHSSDCFPLAIYAQNQSFYHVFWMILDV